MSAKKKSFWSQSESVVFSFACTIEPVDKVTSVYHRFAKGATLKYCSVSVCTSRTFIPLTTTSVAMDTLSTLVWTAQVYFPACLSWMFRIIMSPSERCRSRGGGGERGAKKKSRLFKLQIELKAVQKKRKKENITTNAMSQWFLLAFGLLHYGRERCNNKVQGRTQWLSAAFHDRLWRRIFCGELKGFFQLHPFLFSAIPFTPQTTIQCQMHY